jgi:cardiolipin synthase
VIGSSNMDMRSFSLDYEVSLLGLEPEFVGQLADVVEGYRERSRELTPEEWSTRPWRQRYLDNLMRLTAALQ